MQSVRHIQTADKSALRSLWSQRFHDSESFMDWFFSERFCTEYSLCVEADGRIAGVIHAWPMRVRVLTAELPALMLCGVATHPDYERRGYMHALMTEMLREARRHGIPLVIHTPQDFRTYASLGQLPCTETRYHTVCGGLVSPVFERTWPADELLSIYREATAHYSGCVVRDETAMRLKLADYRSDAAELVRVEGGYAVLFQKENGWYGEEALAVNTEAYVELLKNLPDGSTVKLPPDLPFSGEIRAQGAMGAADVPKLLRTLCGDASMVFSVQDPALPENCGVFDGCGRPSFASPILSLSAGELLQYFCGYMPENAPTRPYCYCIDEY